MRILNAAIRRIFINKFTLYPAIEINAHAGVTHLIGRNGSGKTSLFKAIAGVYPIAGDCTLAGYSLNKSATNYKSLLGYCPDKYAFTEHISALEYVNFVAKAFKVGSIANALDDCEDIGLTPHLKNPISKLSYGNRKKLLLITSIIASPKLWLLDEPLNGIDKKGEEWLRKKIIGRLDHCAILAVCHDQHWINEFNPQRIEIE